MKQDKGREVVIMGKSKYQEKALMILLKDNFKTQRILWNLKNRSLQQEYIYTQVDLVPASSMEQLKYTIYHLKMTQLMTFQYGQLFQTLELRHTIW